MQFTGKAKRLDDIDLPRIASRIGVGEDEIHAVLDVETSGSGFDAKGRPKMLFEPHVFYRLLGPGPKRDAAVKAGLAYPKWGEKPYPKDSYPRLAKAMEINAEMALRSASWGLAQIMGENFSMVGYVSAYAMVEAFLDDEEAHLDAMVTFIIRAGLDDELREHDWAGFARGYNGPGYAKHNYHGRLAAAFAKWSKIKDTPWDGLRRPIDAPVTGREVYPPAPPAQEIPTSPPAGKKPGAGGLAALLGLLLAGLWAAWDQLRALVGL